MVAVIADDITGAAEMAGIAHRYGLTCQLSVGLPSTITTDSLSGTDVLVIATDARSFPAQEAHDITADIARQLYALLTPPQEVMLFRKTDSALRGNVQEELQAIIDNTSYTDAIFMPANPSKGRIIKDGIYYIRTEADAIAGRLGTPLSETDFRFDPEFPATTSNVRERFPNLAIPDAACQSDIDNIVEETIDKDPSLADYDENTKSGKLLLAGAADLFTSLLYHLYPSSSDHHCQGFSLGHTKLIVRGSTQSKAIDLGIPVETMPLDVFYEQSAPCTWAATILSRLSSIGDKGSILTIGDKEVRTGKHAAVYLRHAMAEVTCALLAARPYDELIIEGGATAFAILSQTPWRSFLITNEIAPGVVRMQPAMASDVQTPSGTTTPDIHITLKPGSYDWGKLFCNA